MSFQSDLDRLMDNTVSALETGKSAYSDVSAKYLLYHGWSRDPDGPQEIEESHWNIAGMNIYHSLDDAVSITRAIVKARGSLT